MTSQRKPLPMARSRTLPAPLHATTPAQAAAPAERLPPLEAARPALAGRSTVAMVLAGSAKNKPARLGVVRNLLVDPSLTSRTSGPGHSQRYY